MSEDAPLGSFVAYMSAADADAGANGHVDCALSGSDAETFSLVQKYPSEYQIVTAAALDRERTAEYTLLVKCWDGGSPVSRITEQSFRLIVSDVNDNAPAFSQQTYRGSLAENNFVGLSVLQVRCAAFTHWGLCMQRTLPGLKDGLSSSLTRSRRGP